MTNLEKFLNKIDQSLDDRVYSHDLYDFGISNIISMIDHYTYPREDLPKRYQGKSSSYYKKDEILKFIKNCYRGRND